MEKRKIGIYWVKDIRGYNTKKYFDGIDWYDLLIDYDRPQKIDEKYIGERITRDEWISLKKGLPDPDPRSFISNENTHLYSKECMITDGESVCSAYYNFMVKEWTETAEGYVLDFVPTHYLQDRDLPPLPKKK